MLLPWSLFIFDYGYRDDYDKVFQGVVLFF